MLDKYKDIRELNGREAQEFMTKYLEKVNIDLDNWTTEYLCPETGDVWIEDYPFSEAHGGGPPRLRRMK